MSYDDTPSAHVGVSAESADSRLLFLCHEPLNAESRPAEQLGRVTPNHAFFKRNHFPIPTLSAADWRLTIGGTVEHSIELTYDALRALPRRTLLVTLECAGNGRTGMQPPAEGEPWQYGAVSTAEWTGTPLSRLLEAARVSPLAREIVVTGADAGHVAAAGTAMRYARSLPVEQAMHPDTLLAYAMNGEPLPAEHGFPVRLIVPGWYGMAAVKWVTRIDASVEPFRGFYQAERYVMIDPRHREQAPIPLSTIAVRSLICSPVAEALLPVGTVLIRGLAWSGRAPVVRVEVSVDDGQSWEAAELADSAGRYAWRPWEYAWQATAPGLARLKSRAYDAEGNVQPDEALWNTLGYCNNAIRAVPVSVVHASATSGM